MNRRKLRNWQGRCKAAVTESFMAAFSVAAKPIGKIEACVAAGKTTIMVDIAYDLAFGDLAETFQIDFNVFVAPSRAIVGSHGDGGEAFGIIGALLNYGIWPVERITLDRMAGLEVCPDIRTSDSGLITGSAAVFTYQYLSQKRVQDTLIRWSESGKKIAIHYDEIHHVPEVGSLWSESLRRVNAAAACVTYWSGTWFRTDRRAIKDQATESSPELTFYYPLSEGIQDGHVRPVSFWVTDTTAKVFSKESGAIVDERPVSEYLEELPAHVRRELFNPDGWFVENMIRRTDDELSLRRRKYPDAGCLVVCPPGFHEGDDPEDTDKQDRIAERIHRRVCEITGKRARLILNGHPDSHVREFRESDEEYLVAVNRVAEGCDIPRLRVLSCLRDLSGSRQLFDQIIGRIRRRRKDDDDEPGLALLPPIHAVCEFAREDAIVQKSVKPKEPVICPECERMPCACPCRRCGLRRPCKCPCPRCGQRPCICDRVPLEEFARLEGTRDAHIANGTDIHDRFAARAGAIRSRVEEFSHRDLANIALVLQCDEEVNGVVPTASGDPTVYSAQTIANAQNWVKLRDDVPVKVKQLARFFGREENKYRAAWNHINRKFFQDDSWKNVREDPTKLPFERLMEIHAYMDRAMKGGRL